MGRLQGSYNDLDERWTGNAGDGEFLLLMVVDGCFLLEFLRVIEGWATNDYADDDPVFSYHGMLSAEPYDRRDMLVLENQLPLLVLEKLVAVESGETPLIELLAGTGLSLHPLDVYRKSLIHCPAPLPWPS
ncbi:hypothetical protein AXF42_Ash011843 [Apostasia shenzhenica]|uniref:Uncharacterized protein n=1 Tax=Apostasia shenzhenica TaxID=1088818 RepID=A0A2I0AW15_9ASPA|nr:hypothetical protein AXF42_Ash011843 [Apostasia shenzhenica]